MKRTSIPVGEFNIPIFRAWNDQWYLLTAGENRPGKFNAMTVSWGSFGVIWNKPFAMVVVRPQRHTRTFIDACDSFTLSAFPEQYRKALSLCGSTSGRDTDKIKEAGLTPIASGAVSAPGYEEAELVVECRKVYFGDIDPANFLADYIAPLYQQDYHRMYFGEVLAVQGTEKYRAKHG